MAVSKKAIQEAEQEARNEIAKLISESSSTFDALRTAKQALGQMQDEIIKRTVPYGAGFWGGKWKGKYPQYFQGVPGKILEAKTQIYQDFIEQLEQVAIPKTRREEFVMYDRGHTLEELRQMCRDKGMVVSGTKKELIARLV